MMIITDEAPTLFDVVTLYGNDWDAEMSKYPIWDESRREWLNDMVFEHFAYREIGQETGTDHIRLVGRTMREMMPALNPMFKAIDEEHDILEGFAQTATTESADTGRQLYSATPQTQLSGAENYATNLTDTEGKQTSTTRSAGRGATVGDLLTNWASSVNNALYLVYNGLEPLYQQVFELDERSVRQWQ